MWNIWLMVEMGKLCVWGMIWYATVAEKCNQTRYHIKWIRRLFVFQMAFPLGIVKYTPQTWNSIHSFWFSLKLEGKSDSKDSTPSHLFVTNGHRGPCVVEVQPNTFFCMKIRCSFETFVAHLNASILIHAWPVFLYLSLWHRALHIRSMQCCQSARSIISLLLCDILSYFEMSTDCQWCSQRMKGKTKSANRNGEW